MKFEENKGRFIHKVDYGPYFHEISFAIEDSLGCPFNCEYCFIKAHFLESGILIYTNTNDLEKEIKEILKRTQKPTKFYMGEFSEPLITAQFSDALLRVRNLVEEAEFKVEVRTKCADISALKGIKPSPNIVLAWSFIPESIRRKVETGTPSVEERINAMKEAVKMGWQVGVRFEPLIFYENWEEDYRELLLRTTLHGEITDVEAGSLRLTEEIKKRIWKIHPDSPLLKEEMVPCPDGKQRYPLPVRKKIYIKLREWLGKDFRIYMETSYLFRILSFQISSSQGE